MSMMPFCYVVKELVVGLDAATHAPANAAGAGLIANARYVTVVSWCTFPIVYMVNALGISRASASAAGLCTVFFWLNIPNVNKKYRTGLNITGLITAIATYHYLRIFISWVGAFNVTNGGSQSDYTVELSGAPFNDAYRYVDWLLTVPLLWSVCSFLKLCHQCSNHFF